MSDFKSEQHLIIDWTNYFSVDEMSLAIKKAGLKLVTLLPVKALKKKVSVMSKFYGMPVDDFRGEKDFNAYLVIDNAPVYDYRETSKGKRRVNIKMFDFKQTLRRKLGGGFKIHATDTIQETKNNLRVLGLYDYYTRTEFKDLTKVFDALKGTEYVVLRNFKGFPGKITLDGHMDVDLLVGDYFEAKSILDGNSTVGPIYDDGGYRVLNTVKIDGKEIPFDLRFVGDGYYDEGFEKQILNSRIKRKNFYIPDSEDFLFSLMYHALIHKTEISSDYKEEFGNMTVEQMKEYLDDYMIKRGFWYTRPLDESVGFCNGTLEAQKMAAFEGHENIIVRLESISKRTLMIEWDGKGMKHNELIKILFMEFLRIDRFKNGDGFLYRCRIGDRGDNGIGTFSKIMVDNNTHVIKFYMSSEEIFVYKEQLYERELRWLNLFSGFKHFPKLVSYKQNAVVLEYAGEPVTKETLPKDWKQQTKEIIDTLTDISCAHNDIKPHDLLVKDGVLTLIDFGWALPLGIPVPSTWPINLGGVWAKNAHNLNDKYSLEKTIEFINQ